MRPITAVVVVILIVMSGLRTLDSKAADSQVTGGSVTGWFVENLGQFDDDILFVAQTDFGSAGFGVGKVYFDLRSAPGTGHVVRYEFGSYCVPEGMDVQPGVSNYLRGSDPAGFVVGARHFGSVKYNNVWTGIDLVYRFSEDGLKYDLVLRPGSDPDNIAFTVSGHSSLLRKDASLVISVGDDRCMVDSDLRTVQGARVISSQFRIKDKDTFGFDLGLERIETETVIDPDITSSYLFGGSQNDTIEDVVVAGSGEIYLVGYTSSSDFPTTPGAYDTTFTSSYYRDDVVVSCLDPTGTSLVYSTFIGHTGSDKARNAVLTDDGCLVVAGTTSSTYFPTTPGVIKRDYNEPGECFVLKLSNDGSSLVFSTYFGGGSSDTLEGILLDPDGNYIIHGHTSSSDFPTTDGAYDREKDSYDSVGFISIISPDADSIVASTFFGQGYYNYIVQLGLLSDGAIAMVGYTYSQDYPVTSGVFQPAYGGGYYDSFIAVMTPSLGSVQACSYLGGQGYDTAAGLMVDRFDDLIIVVRSNSTNVPATPGTVGGPSGKNDLFLVNVGPDLTDPVFTFLGGSEDDSVADILLDGEGNLLMTGSTESADYPVSDDAFDDTFNGTVYYGYNNDATFTVVDPTFSSVIFSTYLGGTGDDDGKCLAFGEDLFLGGTTQSNDFGVTANPHNAKANGNSRFFLMDIYGFKPTGLGLTEPLAVTSIKAYSDSGRTTESAIFDLGETIYLEARGLDGNSSSRDGVRVNVSLSKSGTKEIRSLLRETDLNSGVYIGKFVVPKTAVYYDNVTVYPVMDPTRKVVVEVNTPVRLSSIQSPIKLTEHDQLSVHFENLGWVQDPIWEFNTDGTWISFDTAAHSVSGSPLNSEVGTWWFTVGIGDGKGHYQARKIDLIVKNIQPVVLTRNILFATEDEPYLNDYSSDEDAEGGMKWSFSTNASFLELDEDEGILFGKPENKDVGWYWVDVRVHDGNEGRASTRFNLTVNNTNDPPEITGVPITKVDQGFKYRCTFEALDIDPGEVLVWSVVTDADWLSLDGNVLSGVPGPMNVKVYKVGVTVTDNAGVNDTLSYELTVNNINDPPVLSDYPANERIMLGSLFIFDVNATDLDEDTTLEYTIRSVPPSDITIDRSTGYIQWEPSLKWFTRAPYKLDVTVEVTDGKLKDSKTFTIEILSTQPPTSEIISPLDKTRTSGRKVILTWSGTDPEGSDVTFDLYLSPSMADIATKRAEALVLKDYDGTSMEYTNLEAGKTYYWTVIPFDGGSYGKCDSGIRSFTLNNPPTIDVISNQVVKVGTELRLFVKGHDKDEGDQGELVYTLAEAPEGMVIGNSTGVIRWTPGPDQAFMQNVRVKLSDGIDVTELTFLVDVKEEGKTSSPILFIAAGAAAVSLIVIAALLIFLIKRKKRSEKEEDEEGPSTRELRDFIQGQINELEELDKKGQNEAPKEQVIGQADDEKVSVVKVDVPLTPQEAHAKLGKGSKNVSYEDLYGIPAPVEIPQRHEVPEE